MIISKKQAFYLGSFVMVTLITLFTLLLWKSQIYLKVTGLPITVRFESANGLLIGSDVRYRGYSIGKITDIQPSSSNIDVHLLISSKVNISKDAYAKILFDGIVGENYLTIFPRSSEAPYLKKGDVIYGKTSYGMANFIDIGSENLKELQTILNALTQTFKREDVSRSLQDTIQNLSSLSNSLALLAKEFNDLSLNQDLSAILKETRQLTVNLNRHLDPAFFENTTEMVKNLAIISKDIQEITHSEDFKVNVKQTLKGTAKFAKGSETLFDGLSNIKLFSSLSYDFYSNEIKSDLGLKKNNDHHFNLRTDFHSGDIFFRLGLGNQSGKTELSEFQQGFYLMRNLNARAGFFYDTIGLGLDYRYRRLLLELNAYDFETLNTDLFTSFMLTDWLRFRAGVQMNQKSESIYSGGFSFHPKF